MKDAIKTLSVEEIQNIENVIGYTFNKKGLLVQAFTRSSFVNEHKDIEDNEMLEFFGDRSLDLAVTKKLYDVYGNINENENLVFKNYTHFWESKESFFSSIKKSLVMKETLCKRIDDLDLAKYLIMGNGDSANESIKEDLFEAIVGAITLDCNWDTNIINPIVLKLLDFDQQLSIKLDEDSHYGKVDVFYSWYQKKFGCLPDFEYEEPIFQKHEDEVCCRLTISANNETLTFEGQARSKKKARNTVIGQFYDSLFLDGMQYVLFPEDIKDDCPAKWLNCTEDDAINVLQEIEQAKLIKNVKYEFNQDGNDENGNPLWVCQGSFEDNDNNPSSKHRAICTRGKTPNKKDAKKGVALGLVESYLEYKHYIKR